MGNSRTEKAFKHTVITFSCQVLYLISNFIGRTILTKQLGSQYLGINGLFSSILSILSFAELGIGSTLIYRMYQPLASNDEEKIAAYTLLYKKIYRVIISIIAVCGIVIIPFLDFMVDAPGIEENLYLLYLLYLIDTIISYTFVYKKSLLIADQKSYIVSVYTQLFNIIMNVLQCIFLIATKNFIIYFIIRIICNFLNNVFCSRYAQKQYPYIEKYPSVKIDQQEKDGLKSDVKGLLLTKIASTAFGSTDNIFISKYIGITYVGILSNYTIILAIVNTIMNNIFNSITASIGNLSVSEDIRKTEKALYRLFFANTALYCYICIALTLLMQEFVTQIWLDKEYYLSTVIVVVCIIELFYRSIHYPIYTVRNALGLFSQYKVLFAFLALLNILLDFLLIKPMGIVGLLLATIVCRGFTYVIDVYVVYKYGFHSSPVTYIKNILIWSVFYAVEYGILYFLLKNLALYGLPGFFAKIILISILYLAGFLLVFRKQEEFQYFKGFALQILRR